MSVPNDVRAAQQQVFERVRQILPRDADATLQAAVDVYAAIPTGPIDLSGWEGKDAAEVLRDPDGAVGTRIPRDGDVVLRLVKQDPALAGNANAVNALSRLNKDDLLRCTFELGRGTKEVAGKVGAMLDKADARVTKSELDVIVAAMTKIGTALVERANLYGEAAKNFAMSQYFVRARDFFGTIERYLDEGRSGAEAQALWDKAAPTASHFAQSPEGQAFTEATLAALRADSRVMRLRTSAQMFFAYMTRNER